MGGYGSGRWHNRAGKRTTDKQRWLDIRWLKKHKRIRPGTKGSLSWSKGKEPIGSIDYRIEAERIILIYRFPSTKGEWELVKQIISFDLTPCNYGGYRIWFLCSNCLKRVAILYGAEKYFFCRHCYDLAYSSQQEALQDRMIRRARKIRRRLGMDNNLLRPILFKPNNMHQTTFNRLLMEAKEAEAIVWVIAGHKLGVEF